ncbi:MAG: hypothetical protein HXY40_12305 [Chloroflexi bacterium]|nr:hypothetical protein [Chloroflexota bacterium]
MSKQRIAVAFLLAMLIVGVVTVYAGLSFIGGARVTVGSIHGTVDIAGFGNRTEFVTVDMHVYGNDLVASCVNRGGNRAPGQNPVDVDANVSSGAVYPARNGRATVNLSVEILPTAAEAGCPNRNWRVTDLLGTIYVDFVARDFSTNPVTTVTLQYVCLVNQPMQTVDCTQR